MPHPIKDAVDVIFSDENKSLAEREAEARTYLCNTAYNAISGNIPWSFMHGEFTITVGGVSIVNNSLYLNISCKDGQGVEKISDPHFYWNSVIFLIPAESGDIVYETTNFVGCIITQYYREDIVDGIKTMIINSISAYING